jgi:hypothetical protein
MTWLQGELEHRQIKRFYARTNKRLNFLHQISKHERRQRILRKMAKKLPSKSNAAKQKRAIGSAAPSFDQDEPLPPTLPQMHHHIASGQRFYENIAQWLTKNSWDPATKVVWNIFQYDFKKSK